MGSSIFSLDYFFGFLRQITVYYAFGQALVIIAFAGLYAAGFEMHWITLIWYKPPVFAAQAVANTNPTDYSVSVTPIQQS